jgi:hypothetical protein
MCVCILSFHDTSDNGVMISSSALALFEISTYLKGEKKSEINDTKEDDAIT